MGTGRGEAAFHSPRRGATGASAGFHPPSSDPLKRSPNLLEFLHVKSETVCAVFNKTLNTEALNKILLKSNLPTPAKQRVLSTLIQ